MLPGGTFTVLACDKFMIAEYAQLVKGEKLQLQRQ